MNVDSWMRDRVKAGSLGRREVQTLQGPVLTFEDDLISTCRELNAVKETHVDPSVTDKGRLL